MDFTLTKKHSTNNEIESKIENVTEKINNYSNLHNILYNDGIFTNVSLDLGIPYYIVHVETGYLLQTDSEDNIILTTGDINNLNQYQIWNINKKEEPSDVLSYMISSKKTNKCISYKTENLTTNVVYKLEMMECKDENSSWHIMDYNNSYKTILVENNMYKSLILSNGSLNIININEQRNQPWMIKPTPLGLKQMRNNITNEVNNIYNLVKQIIPKKTTFKSQIEMNINKISQTMNELQQAEELYEAKKKKLEEETPNYDSDILEGNYKNTLLTSNSNFYKYIVYFFFTIFVIGSVIFIYMNPEESNLDMFMLAFAISILLYYIYDYYKGKMNI